MNEHWTKDAVADRASRRVWRTAEGEEIPYEKLGDGHLLGILRHLRRSAMISRGISVASLCLYSPGGDGASDACESAMGEFLEQTASEKVAVETWRKFARSDLAGLEELARSRGLDVSFLDKDCAKDMERAELASMEVVPVTTRVVKVKRREWPRLSL